MPKRVRSLGAVALVALVVLLAGAGVVFALGHLHLKRERIPSESMAPTLQVGDVVTVNTGAYDHHPPAIGDVVLFHPPVGAEEGNGCGSGEPPAGQMCARPTRGRSDVLFIKRVVAGPGDRVAMRDGHVIRNGRRMAERYTQPCGGGEGCDFPQPVVVPAGDYLLLGDNRGASDDSRFWGPVPRGWIVGRVDHCTLGLHCSPRR